MTDHHRRPPLELDRLIEALLAKVGRPMSGHQIAAVLASRGRIPARSQIYRTLRRLDDMQRVRRVELLNAYFPSPEKHDLLLVCATCRRTAGVEAPDAIADLQRHAGAAHFKPSAFVIEISGRCSDCAAGNDEDAIAPARIDR